jgi:hypothetical protein
MLPISVFHIYKNTEHWRWGIAQVVEEKPSMHGFNHQHHQKTKKPRRRLKYSNTYEIHTSSTCNKAIFTQSVFALLVLLLKSLPRCLFFLVSLPSTPQTTGPTYQSRCCGVEMGLSWM